MSVSENDALIYPFCSTGAVKTNNDDKTTVWIVPAKFNTMRFINHCRHLSGEREGKDSNPRSVNVSFIEDGNVRHQSEFTRYTVLSVEAHDLMSAAEKFFGCIREYLQL